MDLFYVFAFWGRYYFYWTRCLGIFKRFFRKGVRFTSRTNGFYGATMVCFICYGKSRKKERKTTNERTSFVHEQDPKPIVYFFWLYPNRLSCLSLLLQFLLTFTYNSRCICLPKNFSKSLRASTPTRFSALPL